MPFRNRHIENLLEIPAQMIDGRKRKGFFPSLQVEHILKLIPLQTGKLPVSQIRHEMNGNPVHGAPARRSLPLAAVVGEEHLLNKFPKTPHPAVGFSFRV